MLKISSTLRQYIFKTYHWRQNRLVKPFSRYHQDVFMTCHLRKIRFVLSGSSSKKATQLVPTYLFFTLIKTLNIRVKEKVTLRVSPVNKYMLTIEIIEEGIKIHLELTMKTRKLRLWCCFYFSAWTDFTSCFSAFIVNFDYAIVS